MFIGSLLVDAQPARDDDEQPVRLKPRMRHDTALRDDLLDAVEAVQKRLDVGSGEPAEKVGTTCEVDYGSFWHFSLSGT